MFCSNCGNKIQDDAHYCSVCGHKVYPDSEQPPADDAPDRDVNDETRVTDTVPPVVPPNIPTYPPNANIPPVVPKGKKWSKIWIAAVVLLVLVLGGVVAAYLLGDRGQEADNTALHHQEQASIVTMMS